ncbi:hypothetical protein L1987_46168 [Smallanthus sonchifolius]|uniref:Uncharacterized protein n=1 Tax=Smallanthus sonchifolius TaxID=185202 RepID=A0ACB9FZZ9_9ASTR|nr:hypothetical protein L1987_46168 [Smallanthus sonchifolius]
MENWWGDLVMENGYEAENSGKMVLLLDILTLCSDVGDKALVFNQSLPTLDLTEHHISKLPRNGKSRKCWRMGKDSYRYGQTKPVFAYRLMAHGTIRIANYHEHESLLQENEDEKLSKEEQDMAWEVYRRTLEWEEVQRNPTDGPEPGPGLTSIPKPTVNGASEALDTFTASLIQSQLQPYRQTPSAFLFTRHRPLFTCSTAFLFAPSPAVSLSLLLTRFRASCPLPSSAAYGLSLLLRLHSLLPSLSLRSARNSMASDFFDCFQIYIYGVFLSFSNRRLKCQRFVL